MPTPGERGRSESESEVDEYERLTARGRRRAEGKDDESGYLPAGTQFAQFLRYYGAGAYFGPWRETADGIIPFRMYWLLSAELESILALEELTYASAITHALSVALAGEKDRPKAERAIRDLATRAVPLIRSGANGGL